MTFFMSTSWASVSLSLMPLGSLNSNLSSDSITVTLELLWSVVTSRVLVRENCSPLDRLSCLGILVRCFFIHILLEFTKRLIERSLTPRGLTTYTPLLAETASRICRARLDGRISILPMSSMNIESNFDERLGYKLATSTYTSLSGNWWRGTALET